MTDSGELAGKVAVVTGGSGGIGAAVVARLRSRGATVVVWDMAPPKEGADTDTDAPAVFEQVDVTIAAEVASAADKAERDFGGIDVLVTLAGGGSQTTIEGMTTEDWDQIIGLNLSGPFYAIKACTGAMRRRRGGYVVIVSSLAALRMSMNLGVSYTSAKAGLLGLTRHAAFEYARDNIRVNAILPGPVMTPLMSGKSTPDAIEFATKSMPFGRFLTADEIAQPILFFCTQASSGCTGSHLLVDGGCSIGVVSPEVYHRGRS